MSFQLGNVFKAFTSSPVINSGNSGVTTARKKLLETISDTNSGKDASVETQRKVLDLVEFLETTNPPPSTGNGIGALVDGTWYLDYTQPIKIEDGTTENDENAPSSSLYKVSSRSLTKSGGQVNFLGLTTVDVSGSSSSIDGENSSISTPSSSKSTTTQTIDVQAQRITNRVTKQGFVSTIQVAGSYDIDEEMLSQSKFRIVVSFDTCLIELLDGKVNLDLSFLFDLRALTQNGSKIGGWLETTYVDDYIRIGRGNRGSLFILSRGK
jgi:hypothetical protein